MSANINEILSGYRPGTPAESSKRLAKILRKIADQVERSTVVPASEWISVEQLERDTQPVLTNSVVEHDFAAPLTLRIRADFVIKGLK